MSNEGGAEPLPYGRLEATGKKFLPYRRLEAGAERNRVKGQCPLQGFGDGVPKKEVILSRLSNAAFICW